MKRAIIVLSILLFLIANTAFSQTKADREKIIQQTNVKALEKLGKDATSRFNANKANALKMAKEKGWTIREDKDGVLRELMGVTEEGKPLYYVTYNADAAISTRANTLHSGGSLGLNLEGQGMTAHVWDGGLALTSHQEYDGIGGDNRFSIGDGTTTLHYHSAHVTGTIIASGVETQAKGMAPQASAIGYEWSNDVGEATTAANNGMLVSNHSYGYEADAIPDAWFGQYGSDAVDWDGLMYNAPYYLMLVAAGNDGDDNTSNASPLDGNSSFDKLSGHATAKNNLVVANAQDANIDGAGNLVSVSINSSSSEGPTDDYRIKPDITGNGTSLYSTYETADDAYGSITGTSMATPNVTGSLLLLQQYYNELYSEFMKAATLKGLALHTADDAGSAGPDAIFGWGLLNTKKAADLIASKDMGTIISQQTLANGGSYTIDVTASGTEDLIASISWADPAGSANSGTNSSTAALVNDLDIRITESANTYYPYKLTSITANTTADNTVDPYERIDVASPTAGTVYTITVTHKGTLSAAQNYSLIVSGLAQASDKPIVTTTTITNITQLTATSGGNVIDEGIASVTERGIVWSLDANPTTADNKIAAASTGTGSFISEITGLTSATTYYVRAYAINSEGTSYGENKSFVTECGIHSLPYYQTFNASVTPPLCWSMIDNDGDGNNWKLGGSEYLPHAGNNAMISASWSSSALTPDNWLISPQLEVNSNLVQLKYYVKIMDTDWPGEKYSVLISTTGTETTDFTTIHTETLTASDNVWKEVILDITGHNGDNIYIAFRHYDCTDMFQMVLDDISIEEVPVGAPIAASNPSPSNNATSVSTDGSLTWTWGADTENYDLWFGPTGSMVKVIDGGTAGVEGSQGSYSYNELSTLAIYQWQVVSYNTSEGISTDGSTWGFTTTCGTIASFPYTEDFDGNAIPTCWENVDNDGSGQVWEFNNPGGRTFASTTTANGFAILDSDNYGSGGSQDADLISPTFDFTNHTNITLEFEHYYKYWSGSVAAISYSVDGGSSWTNIGSWSTTDEGAETAPAIFTQDLTTQLEGQATVKFKWNYTGAWGYYWAIDDIQITGTPVPMTYVSSTATQSNTSDVDQGATDQEIIGIEVEMSATGISIDATSFTLSTNGSTDAIGDITNATLYYTGTTNSFDTETQFGSTASDPNGSFTITGTQALENGTNYFWLAYDIMASSSASNVVDAECNSITIGSAQTPTTQAPIGNRTIHINPCAMPISSFPYTQDFSTGDLPQCWGNIDNNGSGQIWSFNNPSGRTLNSTTEGNGFAILDSDNYGSEGSQDADLISPTFDFSTNSEVMLSFEHYYYHLTGSSATLSYSIDNGTTWNVLETWTSSTDNASQYSKVISTEVAGQSSVRFKWNYIGEYDWYWAIDDIEINTSSPCTPPTFQANGFTLDGANDYDLTISWTRGDGDNVIVVAKESSPVDNEPFNNVSYTANSTFGSGSEIGTENFVVYNGTGSSVNVTNLKHGINYYFAIYEYNNPDYCYLIPGLTGTASTQCNTITSFPYSFDFDSWDISNPYFSCTADGSVILTDCWTNTIGDDMDWDIYSGGTSTGSTGPAADHTTGAGNYMYLEASVCSNKTASFTTPEFDLTGYTESQLSFWFHMYGADMGTLSIQASNDGGSTWSSDHWILSGNQGNSWQNATVSLTAYANEPSVIIKFTGLTGSNFTSDIAIDDITINAITTCTAPTTQASNFTEETINDYDATISWIRGNGNQVLVVARKGTPVETEPFNSIIYNANAAFGTGDATGTGDFVVYNGTGSSVTVTNILSGNDYYFAIYEYNTASNCYLTPGLTGSIKTSGICSPCYSYGNATFNTSTTRVAFNTIDNSTGKDTDANGNAFSDFTNLSTDIYTGSSYDLTVQLNTDGNWDLNTRVWIDWNQDCDFDDANEVYDLGTATNVTNGATTNSPLTIAVPIDAVPGETRMRVTTIFGTTAPGTCDESIDGEVEDYALNIIKEFATTFSVSDINDSHPISGANVDINSQTLTTNTSGETSLYLANGTYAYTVSTTGYFDGTGSITVNNGNITEAVELNPYDPITFTATHTNVTCNGNDDGTITISGMAGGSGVGYQYTIDNGTTWQTSSSYTDLTPNTYEVMVKDDESTTSTMTSLTITEPDVVTYTVAKTDVNAGSDGQIQFNNLAGGSGVYLFTIDGSTWGTTNPVTGLTEAEYTVNVKDDNECLATPQTITIVATEQTITFLVQDGADSHAIDGATISINSTMLTSDINGEATINLVHENYPYTVTKSGYSQGSATLTVEGSSFTETVNMIKLDPITFITTPTDVSCNSDTDGTITISNETGGTGTGYQYSFDGGTTWQTEATITELAPDTYDVVVKDDDIGISDPVPTTIGQPDIITFSTNTTGVTSSGSGDGQIEFIITSGGTGAYQYSINGGSTWQTSTLFSGLNEGDYTTVVKDENDCMSVTQTTNIGIKEYLITFIIQDEGAHAVNNASIAINSTTLTTDASGEATIDLANGTYNYTVSKAGFDDATGAITISGTSITENVTLTIPVYNITFNVTDAGNGYAIDEASIAINSTNILTNSSGTANINLSDGNYPYTINKTGYDEQIGTIIVSGLATTENVSLSRTEYTLTFVVKDESNQVVENASISINSNTLTTNTSGEATINLVNGTYSYTVSKAGFDDATSSVTIAGEAVIRNVLLSAPGSEYTLTFVVEDENNLAIQNASIEVNSTTITTDASGEATINLANGTYNYTVSKAGFNNATSSVTISGTSTTVNVTLNRPAYTVTFNITDAVDNHAINEASITINSTTISTGASGVATIDLSDGSYPYTVNKSGYDEQIGTVIVSGLATTENVSLSLAEYTLTFVVKDESNQVVENASISINSNTLTTNTSGEATINLVNGTYSYTVSKAGFDDATSSVTIAGEAVIRNVLLSAPGSEYTLTFVVEDANSLTIQGASIEVNSNTITTDASGEATINLANGTYNYTVSKAGFDNTTSSVTISGTSTTVNVTLNRPVYTVTFNITDATDNHAIDGASITINSTTITTNAAGMASINLENGTYPYTITKNGYNEVSGSVNVANGTVNENLSLSLFEYTLTFVVKDEDNQAVQGASIEVNSMNIITNASGEATINLVNGTYGYTISKAGFDDATGSITISGASGTENVTLTTPIMDYTVTFNVTDTNDSHAIDGATIVINSTTVSTNSSGVATIDLPDGNYPYTVNKTGYDEQIGTVMISGATTTENVNLSPTLYTVTFDVIAFGEPVENGEIEINNTSIFTDANGIATIDLPNGEYPYTLTVEGTSPYADVVIVNNEDVTVHINGGNPSHLVTFNVLENDHPIEGAIININNTEITTDTDGIAEISLELGTYPFICSIEGYESIEGVVDVDNEDVTRVINFTGISDEVAKRLNIYPNPSSGTFTIDLPGTFDVTVFNEAGNMIYKVKTTKEQQIELPDISDGLYLVKIQTGKSMITKQLIIKQ